MALPITAEQAATLDYMLAPVEETAGLTPQAFFGLPPPVPVSSYFGRSRSGLSDPYGFAEKAANYRMRMEAEQQALRIGEMLSGIDPTSPDYPRQRAAVLFQAPLALQDPRGKAMIDVLDFANRESRRVNPDQSFLQRVALEGVTPEEVARFTFPDGTVDQVALGNLANQRRLASRPARAGRSPLDEEISSLTKAYDALDNASGAEARADRERIGVLLRQKLRERHPDEGATQAQAQAPAATADSIPLVTSPEQAAALPSGSRFRTPTGQIKIKP